MISADSGQETLSGRAATLFRSFRAGDEPAMAELVSLLTPILWHTVRAQRLDRDSAEDVVQTTWLALVRNTDSIADPQAVGSCTSWIRNDTVGSGKSSAGL